MTQVVAKCERAARVSLALVLCILVLATSSLGPYDPLTGFDDVRQPAVQTLHANAGVFGKPSGDDDHQEVLVTGLGGFSQSDPRPALTTLFQDICSELFFASAFHARAPPAPKLHWSSTDLPIGQA